MRAPESESIRRDQREPREYKLPPSPAGRGPEKKTYEHSERETPFRARRDVARQGAVEEGEDPQTRSPSAARGIIRRKGEGAIGRRRGRVRTRAEN
jgi:hypothetical protein